MVVSRKLSKINSVTTMRMQHKIPVIIPWNEFTPSSIWNLNSGSPGMLSVSKQGYKRVGNSDPCFKVSEIRAKILVECIFHFLVLGNFKIKEHYKKGNLGNPWHRQAMSILRHSDHNLKIEKRRYNITTLDERICKYQYHKGMKRYEAYFLVNCSMFNELPYYTILA